LKRQRTDFAYEIVVIDNESDDDSTEIAEQMGCKVFTLKREAFTFGHALNYGIERCSGEIILILSAHVILLNELFLQNMPNYFRNPEVAALRFVQTVSPEEVVNSLQSGPKELVYSDHRNFAADNWKKFIVNHCAAIKKSTWREISFDEKVFASEDKTWSLEVLKKGYKLLYNVPCFYVYIKPFNRTTKVNRMIIEEAAKEIITGKSDPLLSLPYGVSLMKKIGLGLKQVYGEVKIHAKVYKGFRILRKKYKDS